MYDLPYTKQVKQKKSKKIMALNGKNENRKSKIECQFIWSKWDEHAKSKML